MTELEKAQKRLQLVNDAIEFVRDCGNQDRKLGHDKHMEGHYTKALQQLDIYRSSAEVFLKRVETVGR